MLSVFETMRSPDQGKDGEALFKPFYSFEHILENVLENCRHVKNVHSPWSMFKNVLETAEAHLGKDSFFFIF